MAVDVDYGDARCEETNGGLWPVFAGLYLVVFAFFILLVSLSVLDHTKSAAVADSLKATFADDRAVARSPHDDGLLDAGASALTELGGALKSLLPVARVERSRTGDVLRVSVPSTEFFADGYASVRQTQTALLDRIVAALASPPKGVRLEATLTLSGLAPGAAGPGLNGGSPGQRLGRDRAGAFARALISQGARPETLAVGLGDGADGTVELQFRAVVERAADGGEGDGVAEE
ncbi:MAG: hypothetical protein IPK66_03915 [Rhodospirillales bacterium]|nr:hypothetical protein [Rhodospirillales bacterium]